MAERRLVAIVAVAAFVQLALDGISELVQGFAMFWLRIGGAVAVAWVAALIESLKARRMRWSAE